jgi:hypothetical protein
MNDNIRAVASDLKGEHFTWGHQAGADNFGCNVKPSIDPLLGADVREVARSLIQGEPVSVEADYEDQMTDSYQTPNTSPQVSCEYRNES